MRKQIFPVSWLIQQRLADVATIVDENINGVRVVKSFAAEPRELRTLARAADRLKWAYIRDGRHSAPGSRRRSRTCPSSGSRSCSSSAAGLVIHGHLQSARSWRSAPTSRCSSRRFSCSGCSSCWASGPRRRPGASTRSSTRRRRSPDRPQATPLTNCEGDVSFEAVRFAYGDGTEVLRDFTLHLRPGETVAMVGRTASGKTTVSRLLPRFYDVTAGVLKIDGHDVRDLTLASLRSQIGVVLDEPFLSRPRSARTLPLRSARRGHGRVTAPPAPPAPTSSSPSCRRGTTRSSGERGYTLSGGQRQRIAIARTLLVNPPILVLDDATSAVDVQVEQDIHEALRVLMEGRTTLIVAHRLSTIGLADRVVLLDGGRIVADGTHTELLESRPLYVEVLAQAEEADRGAAGGGRARRPAAKGSGHELRRRHRQRRRVRTHGRLAAAAAPAAACRSPASRPSFRRAVDKLLATEPEHGEPNVRFSHRTPADRSRRSHPPRPDLSATGAWAPPPRCW